MNPSRHYSVDATKVDSIIGHRPDPTNTNASQYLVRWMSKDAIHPPLTWHGVPQLSSILHLLQVYVGCQKVESRCTKRRISYDRQVGQPLTPESGRSPVGQDHGYTGKGCTFNCILTRREGLLSPATSKNQQSRVEMLDVRSLPTPALTDNARLTRFDDAERAIQRRYTSRLSQLSPPVSFANDYDLETPSLNFKIISSYHFAKGISRADAAMLGCTQCRPNMGANRGCEYTRLCDCLEFAAVDISKLDERQAADYRARQARGDASTEGLPKRFPYLNSGNSAGCLVPFYLHERHPIYECNPLCGCGPRCKNRNVQHGRRVRLQVFKTADRRGFGLRCLERLRKGQFVDTYLGEVISNAEADRREAAAGKHKPSYFFALDKFVGDVDVGGQHRLEEDDCFVVDGKDMGGPSRFINHRCGDPNLQMHTVSYNKNDPLIYDLAFFACCDVPAGEELTFDYMDADDDVVDGEGGGAGLLEGDTAKRDNDSMDAVKDKDKVPCLCGSEFCRGYLWT